MLTVGRKKALSNMECNLHRTLLFENPRKIGQSSHSDLVYFGKVCQGSKGSIHPQPFCSYEFFQAWNSSSSCQPEGQPRPRRSSQLISSLSESHTLRSLCLWWSLMLIYSYPHPPTRLDISRIVNELLPKQNEQKVHFWRSNVSCSEEDVKAKCNFTLDLTLNRLFCFQQ